jgi:hypothetical protein
LAKLRNGWKFRPRPVKLIAVCHRSMTEHNSCLFTLCSCPAASIGVTSAMGTRRSGPFQHNPLPWASRRLHLLKFPVTKRNTALSLRHRPVSDDNPVNSDISTLSTVSVLSTASGTDFEWIAGLVVTMVKYSLLLLLL